jgi:site-specific DNA recombinase
VAQWVGLFAVGRVGFERGKARNLTWREVERRPYDWASRSLQREFEVVIMVEVLIGEMLGRTVRLRASRGRRCRGSLGGPVCDNGRFIRQELLDQIVWTEVIRLLEEPALIHQELDRRLAAARTSDPTAKREQSLQRELTHVGKNIERLLTAYQEELLPLEQLRERMPTLRHRQQTLSAELQAIADCTNDRAAFLRLAETLTAFLARLRSAAETLSVMERQKIVRLLVKDVLVGEDTITIRHSIPIPSGSLQNGGSDDPNGQNYLLCKRRDRSTLRGPFFCVADYPILHRSGIEPFPKSGPDCNACSAW